MIEHRVKSFVGFAVKARKIIYGVDNILTSDKKKPYVVLMSPTLSDNSAEKLKIYAKECGIEVYIIGLDKIIPKHNCKAIGITEKNLAQAVKSELKES